MVGSGPAGAIVEQALFEIIVEWPLWFAPVPRDRGRAPLAALLEAADAPEIAADAAGEMRELDLERRQLVEEPAVNDADRRNHQRELPAQHAAEIVGIELRPGDHLRQWMDEHIEPEIGSRTPERPQRLSVERLALQLRADDHARESKLDRAALELGRSFGRFERGDMGKPKEAPRIVGHRLADAVVDEPADREIGLIEARAEGKHARVDSGVIHHAYVRGEVGEQRIEQVIRIAVLVEPRC